MRRIRTLIIPPLACVAVVAGLANYVGKHHVEGFLAAAYAGIGLLHLLRCRWLVVAY